ncbi:Uncharacterised protein [Salmonella enterica subsp. enterica]|nr:Uncharacterised protein [Salmonella enterica subsp. enterica]
MDDCACAAGALQSGGIVVRKLIIAQRAGEGSGIIDSGGDNRCIGERNVGRINGCRWPVLPASSVAVTVSCSPLICGAVRSILNLPSLSALPSPTTLPEGSLMVMVLPASACPLTVFPSAEINNSPGARGGVVSTGLLLPGVLPLGYCRRDCCYQGDYRQDWCYRGADYRHPNDGGNRRRRKTR